MNRITYGDVHLFIVILNQQIRKLSTQVLKALWFATYLGEELHGLISKKWEEKGWQGRDPSTDFRRTGFISLENLLFFAKDFSTYFQLLSKKV